MDFNKILDNIKEKGLQLVLGLLVLGLGIWLVRMLIRRVSAKIEKSAKIRIDPTAGKFIGNIIRIILYIIVVLTAANIMGIPMTSVLAVVASAGVAVSLRCRAC